MQIQPVDLTALMGTILGISVVVVPVIGLTARFALKPAVEALARVFDSRNLDETVRILERRVELQEHQIEALQGSLNQLTEAREFDRQLAAPGGAEAPRG
jgi:hypothetical protein